MPLITAYHVSDRDDLEQILPSVCVSKSRDQHLFGASVAAFTTTKQDGGFPTTSLYPRNAASQSLGHRYTVEFNTDNYLKFQMARSVGQVHFLLLATAEPSEMVVAEIVRHCLPDTEDLDWNRYFPNGAANDYSTAPEFADAHWGRVFVNVCFYSAVENITYIGEVPRGDEVDPAERVEWLDTLIDAAVKRDQRQVANMVPE